MWQHARCDVKDKKKLRLIFVFAGLCEMNCNTNYWPIVLKFYFSGVKFVLNLILGIRSGDLIQEDNIKLDVT